MTGGVASATSRLCGIIGWPVSHSLSPAMHNAAFAAVGLDWVYVPLPVEPGRIEDAVRGLVALGFAGANVTIPHKTAVLGCCDELDEVARQAASVNTLVVRDGRVHGSSTDGLAVTGALDAGGAHVLVLGAGGAAQAVASALLAARAARLTVAARRPAEAERLARHLRSSFSGAAVDVAAWPPVVPEATVVVNGTPLKEELVVSPLRHQQIVDLAYLPDRSETALVRAAREAGCPRVVDGLEVLVRQGAASFERWTGLEAPVAVMQAAARGEP